MEAMPPGHKVEDVLGGLETPLKMHNRAQNIIFQNRKEKV